MRFLRPFVFAVVLASAFFYFTTYRNGRLHPTSGISGPQRIEITEAAGSETLDSEEQNNINVYRKNIGAVINKEGHILTNYHVIADAREVWVTLHNRKKYKATIVGTDRSHDLAVLQIKATDPQPMILGDST